MSLAKYHDVVIIGSGLSALGGITACIEKKIKPCVIDIGKDPNLNLQKKIDDLKKIKFTDWSDSQKKFLKYKFLSNNVQKLFFGSSYFYVNKKNIPPYSQAKGGMSAGWGASVLPPAKSDIEDWPISYKIIIGNIKKILQYYPLSARNDEISSIFPVLKKIKSLISTSYDKFLIGRLATRKKNILVGQSRLMISTENNKKYSNCQYCGKCMSGCAYNSIFKSNIEINYFIKNNLINYLQHTKLIKYEKNENRIKLTLKKNGKYFFIYAKKVFIACGPKANIEILNNSGFGKYNINKIKSRGGYLLPVFTFKKINNEDFYLTEPSLFIEYKPKFLKHWVHIQVSPRNEILKDNYLYEGKNIFRRMLSYIITNHIIIFNFNFHSDYSGSYIKNNNSFIFKNNYFGIFKQFIIILNFIFFLLSKLFIPLTMLGKMNFNSFHIGSNLPMGKNKNGVTDIYGQLPSQKNIFFIDSSILPNIPATTLGLILLSNAYRIVKKNVK